MPRLGWPVRARSSAPIPPVGGFFLRARFEFRISHFDIRHSTFDIRCSTGPGGGTGRHAGLKILWPAMAVRVQLPPGAHEATKVAFLFMYFVYIIYSEKCNRYYIGYCEDIEVRLNRHNKGMVMATKNCRPYVLKASKAFRSELEARREEARLKRMKSRKYLEWLIAGNW